MNWIVIVWPMIAATSLTLAVMNLMIWFHDRRLWPNLIFAGTTVLVAAFNLLELGSMQCATVQEYMGFHHWFHIIGFGVLASLIWFVRLYLGAGRLWLAWAATAVRAFVVLLEMVLPYGINFREITGIRHVSMAGQIVSVPEAIPWAVSRIGEFSLILCGIFTLDAAVAAWRRGPERRAWLVGGSMTFFLVITTLLSALIHSRLLLAPYLFSVSFLTIVAGVGYELSAEVARAAKLATELGESEQRMKLAADAAQLGMWVWDVDRNKTWVTEKCKELFGYGPKVEISYGVIAERVHPEDREKREGAIQTALELTGKYDVEFRVCLPDGTTRWIASTGRVERNASGKPVQMLGVVMDISERRQAEIAAREVSGRLITAQEDERRRIARDLHDDLNQRLAMLSVELELYGQNNPKVGEASDSRMQDMAAQVKELSSEVHRLAYQLHPAKLDQLGLVAAARSFCREISEQSRLPVDFRHKNIAEPLHPDVSLCLYRVIQESLRNVVRHSGATRSTVEIAGEADCLRVRISDNGRGFNAANPTRRSGLGLISMEERIRLLRGTITFQSQEGIGTAIEIKVPRALPDK